MMRNMIQIIVPVRRGIDLTSRGIGYTRKLRISTTCEIVFDDSCTGGKRLRQMRILDKVDKMKTYVGRKVDMMMINYEQRS